MAFWLEMKTEYWDALPVQYLRRTGAYGRENAIVMAEMKKRITEKGLWQEDTTLWAVPWDNPQTTPPHLCRYDVCTQGLLDLPTQTLPGGTYLIFTLPHTTEALAQAWAGCFNAAAAQGYAIDFHRPVMERYMKKEVDRHRCDLCLPIISGGTL